MMKRTHLITVHLLNFKKHKIVHFVVKSMKFSE